MAILKLFQVSRLASVPFGPFGVFAAERDVITGGFVMQFFGRAVHVIIGYDVESNMPISLISNGLATIPRLAASVVRNIDAVVEPYNTHWTTCEIACAPRTFGIVVLIVRLIQRIFTATGLWAAFGHLIVGNVIAETLVGIMIASTAVCILVDAIGRLINLSWASRVRRTTAESLSSLVTRNPW